MPTVWQLVRTRLTLPVTSQNRRLHLAPPFLVDDYIPRYQTLPAAKVAKKRSAAYAHLRNCNLCPRLCGVNRYEKTGFCLIGAETVKVNVITPHFGGKCLVYEHLNPGLSSAGNRSQRNHVFRVTMALGLSFSRLAI